MVFFKSVVLPVLDSFSVKLFLTVFEKRDNSSQDIFLEYWKLESPGDDDLFGSRFSLYRGTSGLT